MQIVNAIVKRIEHDLGIKAKELNKIIETEIIPRIREELRKEKEAETEALLDEMEFYSENDFSMFGVQKCSKLELIGCVREQRRRTILYLLANGWITDKNIMKTDIWNGKPITKQSMGGRTTPP